MIGRRAAMRAILALPAAVKAAAIVSADEADALIDVQKLPAADPPSLKSENTWDDEFEDLRWALEERRDDMRRAADDNMPPKYRKKSWSPVMQTHYWGEDERNFRNQIRALRKNKALRSKLVGLLGIKT